jgi:hypothetical protein
MDYNALITSHIANVLPEKILIDGEKIMLKSPRVIVTEFDRSVDGDAPEGYDKGFSVSLSIQGKKCTMIKEDEDKCRIQVEDVTISDAKVFSYYTTLIAILDGINEMIDNIAKLKINTI